MKTWGQRRRPTELFHGLAFAAVETVEVSAPNVFGPGRGLTQIGEGKHHFDLPECILVAGVANRAFQFNRALHSLSGELPIAAKILRHTVLIKLVVDDGVEYAAQRIPLEFEVSG